MRVLDFINRSTTYLKRYSNDGPILSCICKNIGNICEKALIQNVISSASHLVQKSLINFVYNTLKSFIEMLLPNICMNILVFRSFQFVFVVNVYWTVKMGTYSFCFYMSIRLAFSHSIETVILLSLGWLQLHINPLLGSLETWKWVCVGVFSFSNLSKKMRCKFEKIDF